jgi:hypothetical protein
MTAILRFIGIMNAAIWLGGSVYFSFVAGKMPFSAEMQTLLGPESFPYYSGAIAQVGVASYFNFHLFCGVVALLHLTVDWLYQGRRNRLLVIGVVVAIFIATLLGAFVFQPKMKLLHKQKYAPNYTQVARDAAAKSFKRWHAVSMTLNLLILGGLVVHTMQMTRPPEIARFVRTPPVQFRS